MAQPVFFVFTITLIVSEGQLIHFVGGGGVLNSLQSVGFRFNMQREFKLS